MNRYQRGQALPLGLALALVGMLGALVLFNTGRVATDKARLANAADAAAYSGLLWQARALNYQAYTNRAMIANQVSIAQAVSLSAWTAYGEEASRNIAHVLSAVPPMKIYGEGVAQVMRTLDGFVAPIAEAMVHVVDLVNRGVAASQQAMFASSFAATPEIVSAVARSSDPRFRADTLFATAGLGENLDGWRRFTSRYDVDDREAMRSRTELVNGSLDDFSRERKWRLFEGFWFYSTPITRHKIFREGGTRLVYVEDGGRPRWEWKAVDTLSLQNRIFRFARKEKKQEVPIGWGMAYANDAPGSRSLTETACRGFDPSPSAHCGRWTANGTAERWAERFSPRSVGGYHGLNPFRSLSAASLAPENGDPILRLRTEVALDTSAVRSSGTFVDGERFRADIAAPGERLSSISAAELYYRRPDEDRGADLSTERATGYNPYWTVRLAPVSDEERLAALALRGPGGTVAPRGTLAGATSGAVRDGADATLAGADAIGDEALARVEGALPDHAATLADGWDASDAGIDVAALEASIGSMREFELPDVGDVVGIEDPAGAIDRMLGDALDGAVDDILSGSFGRAVGEAGARIDGAVERAEGTVGALAERIDSVGDALGGEGCDAGGTEAMADTVDADDVSLFGADYFCDLHRHVDAARSMAESMEAARQEIARRMDEAGPLIDAMLRERIVSLDFEDQPFWLPREYRGYDFALLAGITDLFMATSYAVDPELPMHRRMAVEASKYFYTEAIERLTGGRLEGEAPALGEEIPGVGGTLADVSGDAVEGSGDEDGEGAGDEPVVIHPWVEDEDDDPWLRIDDADD